MKDEDFLEVLDRRIEDLERKYEATEFEGQKLRKVVRSGLGERIQELKYVRDDIAEKCGEERQYENYPSWPRV